MTRREFDAIFDRNRQKLMNPDSAHIANMLKTYSQGRESVSSMELAMFAYMESMKYANDMIYAMLSECLNISD